MTLTVPELALAVGKGEGFIRQHIHRKHLSAHKRGRNVVIELDEAISWAQKRGLPFVPPARVSVTTPLRKERVARLTVLSWHPTGAQARNLLTLLRHRRSDSLGPWAREPSTVWSSEDLGHEVRLSTLEASLDRCQESIDHILDSGVLEVDGLEVHYDLEPVPRRHWAYQDLRPGSEVSVVTPFTKHSAQVVEYWSLAPGPRDQWKVILKSIDAEFRKKIAHLGFPLHDRVERAGNLMVAGAEDAIDVTLEAHRDHTLTLRVESTEQLTDEDYRATVWASHSGDDVLRQELPVTLGQTVIDLASDVDHIGYSIIRTDDSQCVDLLETHLIMEFSGQVSLDVRPTIQVQDRGGRLIHRVKPSGFPSMINVRSDRDGTLDQGVRRLWLEYQIYEREPKAVTDSVFVRFEPAKFREAVRHFISLLSRESDRRDPVYLADRYFMTYVKGLDGARLYLDMFAATAGAPLRILCADNELGRGAPWWTSYPRDLTQHVAVRSFLRADGKPAFHDRYLITPKQETVTSDSFRGWMTNGVTFASHSGGLYRKETEELWSTDLGSSNNHLLVREIR